MADDPIVLSVPIPDPEKDQPSKILAFDPQRKVEPQPVDLDSPFFAIKHTSYPDCDHRNRGVELDMATRRAICLCGVEIDSFDALLIYAHAQQRLVHHREAIAEHERREAEKKAKKPHVKDVDGYSARFGRSGKTIVGYTVRLACRHETIWWRGKRRRRHPPRTMLCEQCVRAAKLETQGVGVMPHGYPKAAAQIEEG